MSYLVQDALSAFEFSQRIHPELKCGFVGFSEGAWISVLAAKAADPAFLFLLGLPTRGIDDIFSYQFLQWPISIIEKQKNQDTWQMPLLGQRPAAKSFDEVAALYQQLYRSTLSMLSSHVDYGPWYAELKELESFAVSAASCKCPVYVYHAKEDAQVYWAWTATDALRFSNLKMFRVFENLGHCFSPMKGAWGEIKTSGPFSDHVLEVFQSDLNGLIALL